MDATLNLAKWLVGLNFDDLSQDVVAKCKELILDSLACGIGGSQTPLGVMALELAKEMGGNPQATVWGSGFRTSSPSAAFVNATAANAMDYDDTSPVGHPGSSVVPAVWALGEQLGSNGKSIIEACVAGYEVTARVASAIKPSYQRYRQIHGIGSAQIFGAVAGCSKLLKHDLENTLNAFGIAGASAPVAHAGKFGWKDKTIGSIKDNVAWPSEAGMRAALLAGKGYHGSESILDGEHGFWIMAGSDQCDFRQLTDFGSFRILQVSLKPYPCCRWIHTTLDIIGQFMKEEGLKPGAISGIKVFSTEAMADCFGGCSPKTFIDAQFSLPIAIALKLHQIAHQDWFRAESWNNPQVLDTAGKVKVFYAEEQQNRFLELKRQNARIPAKVEITTSSGSKLAGYSDLAWGAPEKPLSKDDRLAKCKNLTRNLLSPGQQDSLIARVEVLDELPGIHDLWS